MQTLLYGAAARSRVCCHSGMEQVSSRLLQPLGRPSCYNPLPPDQYLRTKALAVFGAKNDTNEASVSHSDTRCLSNVSHLSSCGLSSTPRSLLSASYSRHFRRDHQVFDCPRPLSRMARPGRNGSIRVNERSRRLPFHIRTVELPCVCLKSSSLQVNLVLVRLPEVDHGLLSIPYVDTSLDGCIGS